VIFPPGSCRLAAFVIWDPPLLLDFPIFPFPIVVCRQNYAAIHKNGWQKNHWRYFNADMLF